MPERDRAPWSVHVSVDDNDPQVFGPYTRTQAERVAARIMADVRLSTTRGASAHPGAVTYAIAVPLERFDGFLTAEERRQVRREVRREHRPE